MNGYAVQDLVIKQAQTARDEAAKHVTQRQQESQARTKRATELIEDRMPDLVIDGRPCDWAVWALMDLWYRHGEGNVTAAQVRELRGERVGRLLARGWVGDPFSKEATGE